MSREANKKLQKLLFLNTEVYAYTEQDTKCYSSHVCTLSLNRAVLDDGWMIYDLLSFLTVLKSYQDDVWVIMKGCVQQNPVYN